MNTEYGDETELEIIIEAGQREAEEFSNLGAVRPAKWLNPPRPVNLNHWSAWDGTNTWWIPVAPAPMTLEEWFQIPGDHA